MQAPINTVQLQNNCYSHKEALINAPLIHDYLATITGYPALRHAFEYCEYWGQSKNSWRTAKVDFLC